MKLSNCPFCGKKVGWYINGMNAVVGIQCKSKKCGITFVFFTNSMNEYYNDKKKIAEKFNARS